MSPSKTGLTKLLTLLKQLRKGDNLGVALAAIGVFVLAIGLFLQGLSVGVGTPIRTIGGLLLLAGIATFVFRSPHRRAVVIGAYKAAIARYTSITANWRWPDRIGLAGVIIGLIWLVPVLGLRIIFGSGVNDVMLPGILLFWCGIALLIFGRFHGKKDAKKASDSQDSSRGSKEGRSKRRFW